MTIITLLVFKWACCSHVPSYNSDVPSYWCVHHTLSILYTENFVNRKPLNFTFSSAYHYSACWLSLWVVLTKHVCMKVVWQCQFWSTTLHWWCGCGWGQRPCTCTRNWSLCLVPTSLPKTSLASHLSVGVSFHIFDTYSSTLKCYRIACSKHDLILCMTVFTAVAPVVPVAIPLAIDRDFMVTFSPPTLNTAIPTNNTSSDTDMNTGRTIR